MALLSVSNLEKSYGARAILKGLSFSLERGDRLGLIGRNGCGKTTLLRIIAGQEQPDRGEIFFARDVKLAWLEQNPAIDPERTVWDEARTALADLDALEQRLAQWHHKIADAPEHKLSTAEQDAFARDEQEFVARRGHDRERLLQIALKTLGLDGQRLQQRLGQLSGGERTRLGLAKFLASPFDVLILDEPTNHLDIDGIEWLQEALLESAKTFIVVSHDRAFLDALATKVAELGDGKLTVVNGNYSQFMTVKAERLKTLQRQADLESDFLAKELDFIRRHIAGQRTREAKGRLKRLERREKIEVPRQERAFQLRIKGGDTNADVVLSVSQLSKAFGTRALFENLTFDLGMGEKLGIVGANGTGKTTLVRVLLGELEPTAGKLRLAPQLRVGTFTQDLRYLRDDRTILEEYARLVNPPNLNVARGPLGAFLFSGDRINQRVENLSGGERARLALCILVARENDVLLLDEPTNHLDIPSRQALEEALDHYKGTCLIISHDRFFLDRITDRTLWVEGPRTKVYYGAYSEAREARLPTLEAAAAAVEAEAAREKRAAEPASKPRKVNEFKLNQIETEIAALDARKQQLGQQMYAEAVFKDGNRVREISVELQQIEQRLLQLNKDWEAVIDAAG